MRTDLFCLVLLGGNARRDHRKNADQNWGCSHKFLLVLNGLVQERFCDWRIGNSNLPPPIEHDGGVYIMWNSGVIHVSLKE